MEGLRKLEQAQSTLLLMQSRGVISSSNSNPDSDRFLANLILLLLQPCGELDMEKKCQLINENLPKISDAFLDKALPCSVGEGNSCKTDIDPLCVDYKDMAMVGLTAMQDAISTLEDFCRSYFMFHNMDVNRPQSIFRYLPILSFTESYIYQLDRLNERIVPTDKVEGLQQGFDTENNRSCMIKSIELLKTDPFRPLILLLEHQTLLTDRMQEEFRCGEEYWALERKLCSALIRNQKIFLEDVMRAIHLKSFDYRVLNLLLYQLRGEEVNELHMEFLSASEFLVELSDDLFDYEDDVLENNFNVLRMFVGIYGASTAPIMLAKCIGEAEEKYECLLKALDPELSRNYQKRCEEASKEGGKISGPSLGTWSIPPVIADENLYRSESLNSKSSVVSSTGQQSG